MPNETSSTITKITPDEQFEMQNRQIENFLPSIIIDGRDNNSAEVITRLNEIDNNFQDGVEAILGEVKTTENNSPQPFTMEIKIPDIVERVIKLEEIVKINRRILDESMNKPKFITSIKKPFFERFVEAIKLLF